MRDPALSIGFAPCPICGADLDTFVTDPDTHCQWETVQPLIEPEKRTWTCEQCQQQTPYPRFLERYRRVQTLCPACKSRALSF